MDLEITRGELLHERGHVLFQRELTEHLIGPDLYTMARYITHAAINAVEGERPMLAAAIRLGKALPDIAVEETLPSRYPVERLRREGGDEEKVSCLGEFPEPAKKRRLRGCWAKSGVLRGIFSNALIRVMVGEEEALEAPRRGESSVAERKGMLSRRKEFTGRESSEQPALSIDRAAAIGSRGERSPEAATSIIRRLQEAHDEAYLVAGCVRDELLGLLPKDHDVVTSATPEEVRSVLSDLRVTVPDVGKNFGVFRVVLDGEAIELATSCTDSDYADGRRRTNVKLLRSAQEDAA